MSGGAWDAMLQHEAATGAVIRSVPGIPPREVAPPEPVRFSQAGLASVRRGTCQATPDAESTHAEGVA